MQFTNLDQTLVGILASWCSCSPWCWSIFVLDRCGLWRDLFEWHLFQLKAPSSSSSSWSSWIHGRQSFRPPPHCCYCCGPVAQRSPRGRDILMRTLLQWTLQWFVQGDHSGCSLGLVDIKTKVVFQYMLLTRILKSYLWIDVNST